jgi:lantibiotic modifying enzyme
MRKIEDKLNEIAQTMFQNIADKRIDRTNQMGLYSGKSGIILFLSHYLNKYPNKTFEYIYQKYLNDFLQQLTDEPQALLTYCSGLAGVFEALRMMNESSLIEIDYSEIEAAYNNRMRSWVNHCFANQNYDFLHGALGVSVYFRNNPQYIEDTLRWLEKTAIKDGDKLKWISSLGQDRPQGYNICLSHGMSSIIVYLSQVYRSGVLTELNKQLLEGTANYVLSQEIDHKQYGCYFASQSLENDEPISKSRLAWCYGDLGVAAALWQAGRVIGNDLWSNKALEVYQFSAHRTDLQDAMVRDAGLCHGTAGIAMMFAFMYRETLDETFKNARDYWAVQTLNMSRFPDGYAGYKKFTMVDDKRFKWENSCIILEGIAGIGFMLLSILDVDIERNLLTLFALS